MGYVREPTVYRLKFADPAMAGLVVRAKGLTVGELLAVTRWREASAEEIEQILRLFADHLVEWNLEQPEGVPVPATYESLLGLDDNFVLAVVDAWMEAVAGVPAPLGASLSGGEPSAVVSLPMEPLSESQAS